MFVTRFGIATLPQEEGNALFMEKRFAEATERYVAAADSASAVPEKTEPEGEEEKAAVDLEVRSVVPQRIFFCACHVSASVAAAVAAAGVADRVLHCIRPVIAQIAMAREFRP